MEEQKKKPVIGISIGDMNGIGPEVIIKSVMDNKIYNQADLVVYGHGKVLSYYKKNLGLERFSFNQTYNAQHLNHKRLNVINCWADDFEIHPGADEKIAGAYALKALEKATDDLKAGHLDAVVTAPINKNNIQSEEFDFPGHTEYLTDKFEAKESLMFLCNEHLRIGVATGHIPLMSLHQHLTSELLEKKIQLMTKSCKKDFGIQKPKIAVLGLNPHAGEEGLLGNEENDLITPVITKLKDKGELVYGPFAADGFFGNASYQKYDAVLGMYHDQGLIPFKTIAFEDGVNFTAGLNVIRTSPDHGTAYNIAGKNEANAQSMRSAIYMAIDISIQRSSL